MGCEGVIAVAPGYRQAIAPDRRSFPESGKWPLAGRDRMALRCQTEWEGIGWGRVGV